MSKNGVVIADFPKIVREPTPDVFVFAGSYCTRFKTFPFTGQIILRRGRKYVRAERGRASIGDEDYSITLKEQGRLSPTNLTFFTEGPGFVKSRYALELKPVKGDPRAMEGIGKVVSNEDEGAPNGNVRIRIMTLGKEFDFSPATPKRKRTS